MVGSGCSHTCSYCIVWRSRGKLKSVPRGQVLRQFENAYIGGQRRFFLIADELSSYGSDLGGNNALGTLLESIFTSFPDVALYLRYLEPMAIEQVWPDIERFFVNDRIRYVSIPLQSVSPAVLKRMKRPTDMLALEKMLRELRKTYSGPLLTHAIVGAPYETRQDIFTMSHFLLDYDFDDVSVYDFSARPGSLDAKELPHPDVRYHREILEKTRKQLRARWLLKSLNRLPVVQHGSRSSEVEREFRFPVEVLPEAFSDFVTQLNWSECRQQTDIVFMHQDLSGFVARLRCAEALSLQFKIQREHRTWIEHSVDIPSNEAKAAFDVLSEFLSPVVVVDKSRKSCCQENGIKLYFDNVTSLGDFVEVEGVDGAVDQFLFQWNLDPNQAADPYGKILRSKDVNFESLATHALSRMNI